MRPLPGIGRPGRSETRKLSGQYPAQCSPVQPPKTDDLVPVTQHRNLQAMQLPPVIPAVHIEYIHADLRTVQALDLVQHELAKVAALAAVDGQLDQDSVAGFTGQRIAVGSLQRPGDHFHRTNGDFTNRGHKPGAGHCRIGIGSSDS
jgi:hypothetical protein